MSDPNYIDNAFELGSEAGSIGAAQAWECPYPHGQSSERQAWMDGFSVGRISLASSGAGASAHDRALPTSRRPVPFGSRVVYHHSTRTIAVDYQGDVTFLGPYEDEDAAYEAAFIFVEMRRADRPGNSPSKK